MTWLVGALGILLCGSLAVLAIVWRRSRRLAQALRETQAEPAIIAHEIRTPLTLIRGAAELLEEETPGALTDTQRTFVRTINENSRLVYDISENFLTDLSLRTSRLSPELIDIRSLAFETASELRKISDVPIAIDAVGGVLNVEADTRLVRQLLWNLVNNAARHAGPDASITVRIRAAEAGSVHITVSDDGLGMDEADLERLYAPFVSGSTRRPGNGIGMMVSHKIVEAHGGRLFVDSTPGVGTVMHVLLPRTPRTAAGRPRRMVSEGKG